MDQIPDRSPAEADRRSEKDASHKPTLEAVTRKLNCAIVRDEKAHSAATQTPARGPVARVIDAIAS